jgi:hypothetical protein
MSIASQLSFGNAAVLTTGTLPGDRGVTSGVATTSFVEYNGTTSTSGQFDGGTTAPAATTRLNYNGNLHATFFVGNGSQLTGITVAAGSSIANGTSNVVVDSSGSVRTSVAGTANVMVVSSTTVTAPTFAATTNGTAQNFKVGDDAWLGDINTADTVGLIGQQSALNGYIVFGNNDTTAKLGRAGSGPLTYTGAMTVSANITSPQLISNVATGTAPLTVTSTTRVANLNVAQANVSDFITVAAGTGNNFLIFANAATGNISELTSTGLTANLSNNSITATTFVGALSGAATSATTAGTVTTASQPNITSVGSLTSLGVTGNISAGNVSATLFTGSGASLTNIPAGNITGTVASATTAGTVTTAAQPNITSVGSLTSLGVTGNISAGNVSATLFTGSGANLTSIPAANITGTVASATTAGTVSTAAQPNITSVGTLTSLGVTGNISAGNVSATLFTGSGASLTNIPAGNITGTVASATTAGTVTTASQPNITSVGTLTSLGVTGNISAGNVSATTFTGSGTGLTSIPAANITGTVASATTAGTVSTAAQPNITSVGTLSSLIVTGTTTSGNFATAGNITASFLVSNVAVGTAPLTVTSTTRVNNLNVAYANVADNINVTAGTGNNFIIFANAATGNVTELTSTGLIANLSNNSITATTFVGALSGAATSATTAGTVTTAAQGNITSVGTLTSLAVSGTTGITSTDSSGAASSNKIINAINGTRDLSLIPRAGAGSYNSLVGADDAAIVFANSSAQGNGNLTIAPWSTGNTGIRIQSVSNTATIFLNATNTNVSAALNVSGVSNLGSNANVIITGGSSGQLLSTNGSGNLSWVSAAAGGGYYLYTQAVSSATWTVVHNLNRQYVTVEPIDSTGNSYTGRYDYPTIKYNNANALTITFTSAVTGWAAVTGGGTSTSTDVGNIANGNSSVGIPTANGNINLVSVGNATMIVTGTGVNVSGALNANGNVTLTQNASQIVTVQASQPPTTDMVVITNAGQNVATAGVSAMQVTYVGGAAAVEASAYRTDLTPGSTTGGTWNGFRMVGTSGAVSGVTMNAIKIDNITGGAGTENMILAGTGWDNILNYNGTSVIFGNGTVNASQVTGAVANATFATTAGTVGTVTTNAQPNITSVGTLSSLNVTGNVAALNFVAGSGTGGNISGANVITANTFIGNLANGTSDISFLASGGNIAFDVGGVSNVFVVGTSGAITSANLADAVGYKGLPQNSQTSAYTLALIDMGKHIGITTGGVVIPANGTVAFPIGATIVIFNNSATTQTISITTDTLRQAGTTNTGSRTLAAYGVATVMKAAATVWVITGNVT